MGKIRRGIHTRPSISSDNCNDAVHEESSAFMEAECSTDSNSVAGFIEDDINKANSDPSRANRVNTADAVSDK